MAVHVRALGGEFVSDDLRFVRDNTAIGSLSDPLRFFTDPRTASPGEPADIYRPLRTVSFAIEHAVFGGSPAGYHAVSVLLHAANAGLLFLLLGTLGLAALPAALAAVAFAVHPATVEPTAWISGRADLMAAFFTLLAVHGWTRAKGWDRACVLALGAGLLACLSKEAAVVFPGFLLLADLAPERRPRWRLLVPAAVLAGGFALVARSLLEGQRDGGLSHLPGWWGGTYAANLGTAARAGAFQALFALFPAVPSFDWYMEPGGGACAVLSGLFLLALLVLSTRGLLLGGASARLAGAGILWAFLGGLLTSHLVFRVGIPTAERFLYLSLAGVSIAGAVLLDRLLAAWPRHVPWLAGIAVAGLAVLTFDRIGIWRDEDRLWTLGPAGAFSPRGESRAAAIEDDAAMRLADRADEARRGGETATASELLRQARAVLDAAARRAEALRDRWLALAGAEARTGPIDAVAARIGRDAARVLLMQGDAAGAREAALSSLGGGQAVDLWKGYEIAAAADLALGRIPAAGWEIETALRFEALCPAGSAERSERGLPARTVAEILNAAGRWRLARGLDGAALRAFQRSAAILRDGTGNPAVAAAQAVGGRIRRREEELASGPADPAARVAYAGLGSGDAGRGRAAFAAAFGAAPESGPLRTLKAVATLECEDTREGWVLAAVWHRETLRRFPGEPGAQLGLGRCLEILEDRAEAAAAYEAALANPAAPPDVLGEARQGLQRLGR